MRLLSIDVETTGLNWERCGILEIGCVLFDPQPQLFSYDPDDTAESNDERKAQVARAAKWQHWECLIDNNFIQGEPFALQMNQEILAEISGANPTHIQKLPANRVATELRTWLGSHGVNRDNKVTIVGKNYSEFDARFLEKIPGWSLMPFERRVLDVGSMFFKPEQGKVLNLANCLALVNQEGLVTHRALEDAQAVATACTRLFN